jgi:hypothetical protein
MPLSIISPAFGAAHKMRRALWAGLLLAVVAVPAAAQWKWRDATGQVHASDIPPPRDVPEKNIMQRPDPTVRAPAPVPAASAAAVTQAGSPNTKPAVDPQLEEQRRRLEQDKLAREKAEADKQLALRKENCQRARDMLNTLDSGQRIARVKPGGEREILSDEQRAAEARRTREAMATDCR